MEGLDKVIMIENGDYDKVSSSNLNKGQSFYLTCRAGLSREFCASSRSQYQRG